MAQQAQVPVNPLFAGAPHVEFRDYANPQKMAGSFKRLHRWIKRQLAAQVAAENGQQFLEVMVEGRARGYRLQFTADGGFFTVLVKGPAGWDPMVRDVLLAFSFRDLYLLGFLRNDIWQLYDDAFLIGSGADVAGNAAYWRPLGFDGGYCEGMRGLPVGMEPMFYALHTLCNPNADGMAVQLALYQFIVTIPEAIRFPQWRRYLMCLLRRFQAEPLYNPILSQASSFNDWSKMCKRIRRGPAAFVPGDGFNTYRDLVKTVFLLLSRPPQHEL